MQLLQERQFYTIYDFEIEGTCYCNGHAHRCMPIKDANFTKKDVSRMLVFGKCDCFHNTTGNNCEMCESGFYLPEGNVITSQTPCERENFLRDIFTIFCKTT
jgi:hypothetical protein